MFLIFVVSLEGAFCQLLMLWAWEMVYALVGMSSIKLASTEIRSVKILCHKNFQLYGPGVKALCRAQKHVGNSGGMFPGKFNTFQFQIGPEGTLMLCSSLLQIIILLYWGPHRPIGRVCFRYTTGYGQILFQILVQMKLDLPCWWGSHWLQAESLSFMAVSRNHWNQINTHYLITLMSCKQC